MNGQNSALVIGGEGYQLDIGRKIRLHIRQESNDTVIGAFREGEFSGNFIVQTFNRQILFMYDFRLLIRSFQIF